MPEQCVWFSASWGMKEVENVFLTHGWEPKYKGAGISVTWLVQGSVFVLPSAIAWHAPPNHEVFLEHNYYVEVKLFSSHLFVSMIPSDVWENLIFTNFLFLDSSSCLFKKPSQKQPLGNQQVAGKIKPQAHASSKRWSRCVEIILYNNGHGKILNSTSKLCSYWKH